MISAEQEFVLRSGRVPAKKKAIYRKTLLEQLYSRLQPLIGGENQWLVVHGMPGTGKTQLVLDLFWDRPELVFCHFDKIFWLTDRNIDQSRVLDIATDTLIMLSGSANIDAIPTTIQSIGQLLHEKLTELECSSKILVVLDGIMLADTVRFFDNLKTKNCCFLATSTSLEIFSCVQDASFYEINTSNALCRDQLVDLAAEHKLGNLTNAQLDMLAEVSGNNLAVLDKLLHIADRNTQIIPSLLHRLKFRPLKELSCTSQYHYPSMDIPLHLCFQMLDDRISAAFENWTVFQPSKWTPLDVLSLSWPMDLCGFETDAEVQGMVVQDLRQLVHNSLLEECRTEDRRKEVFDEDRLCYRIHPLVHSYLLHCRPEGYIKFMKSLNHLSQKVQDESESKLNQYYSQNRENLKKIEKNVLVILQKDKQHSQTVKCTQKETVCVCKTLLFLGSAFRKLLGLS